MTTKTKPTVSSSFVGRAVHMSWDGLPQLLPVVVFVPLIVFGGLVIGTYAPLAGFPIALPFAGVSGGWAVAVALQSAMRLGELDQSDVRKRSATGAGALLGIVGGGAVLAMNAASLAAQRGAPALVTAPAWGAAVGLLVIATVCGPRFLVLIAMGFGIVAASSSALVSVVSAPLCTLGCAAITGALVVSALVWGPIGLGCALIVVPALYVMTMRTRLHEGQTQR